MQQLITNQFLENAQLGRECYISLKRNYKIQDDAYIFIVDHSNAEFYLHAIEAIKNYIHKNEITVCVLVDECMQENDTLHELQCIFLPSENIDHILSFYNLYLFTDNLYIFSAKSPSSRTTYYLVEQGIISMKEFIEIGILKSKNS